MPRGGDEWRGRAVVVDVVEVQEGENNGDSHLIAAAATLSSRECSFATVRLFSVAEMMARVRPKSRVGSNRNQHVHLRHRPHQPSLSKWVYSHLSPGPALSPAHCMLKISSRAVVSAYADSPWDAKIRSVRASVFWTADGRACETGEVRSGLGCTGIAPRNITSDPVHV